MLVNSMIIAFLGQPLRLVCWYKNLKPPTNEAYDSRINPLDRSSVYQLRIIAVGGALWLWWTTCPCSLGPTFANVYLAFQEVLTIPKKILNTFFH